MCVSPAPRNAMRSEEHTSELQSLMRISYAVFCLHRTILLHPFPTRLASDMYRWLVQPGVLGLEDTLRRAARRRAGGDGHLWLDPSPAISRLHTRDVRVPAAMADAADAPHVSGVGRHVCASRPHRGTRCDRKLRHRL